MNRILSALLIIIAVPYVSCLEDVPGRNNPLDPGGENYQGWSAPVLSAPSKGRTYNLSWTDIGVGSYLVEEAPKSDFSDAASYPINGVTLSFSHNDAGSTYYYRVKTNTGAMDSGWSNVVEVTVSTLWEEAGIEYVVIPGGTFRMGDIQGGGGSDERPVHDVTLTGFEMSATEITQWQYKDVTGNNPSYFRGTNLPVEQVSWYDAVKYCNRLSDAAGLDRCYDVSSWSCDYSKKGFRLPTEAEWEYACRAGTETKYYTGDRESDLAEAGWYSGNSGFKTHPVGGLKTSNAYGLYDMHGNEWEWCNDWYDSGYYLSSPSTDPTGPSTGSGRVLRGGSWSYDASYCRSASRRRSHPTSASYSLGFRVVRRP